MGVVKEGLSEVTLIMITSYNTTYGQARTKKGRNKVALSKMAVARQEFQQVPPIGRKKLSAITSYTIVRDQSRDHVTQSRDRVILELLL